MYCPNCGKEIIDGSKFCSLCGKKIETAGNENFKEQRNVEEVVINAVTAEDIENETERTGKNVVISFMTETMYKLFFYGSIVGGILTALEGIGIVWIILTLFIMKQKWAAKVKGFIVDYEKKTIYFPECNKITYDTGFPGIKNWINDFRSGKEISFTQLKSITGDAEREIKRDSNGNYNVNDYNILNILTTFGTIRLKIKFTDSRFEQIVDALNNVIDFNENNIE